MRRLPLLGLLALLLGCPAKVTYPECRTDQDCAPEAQVCVDGFCRECRDDAQCAGKPDRPVCRNGGCAAKVECATDQDCPGGTRCAAGKCAPECTPGTATQDCGAGRRCVDGRCAASDLCTTDADCGPGRACVDQRCTSNGVPISGAEGLGGACQVRKVQFGFDEATLSPQARQILAQDWACLQHQTFRRLVIAGHTDERGTTEYNLALAMSRADSVKKYLVDLGADPARLKAISFGKERPFDPAHTESAWAKNRRAELLPEQ